MEYHTPHQWATIRLKAEQRVEQRVDPRQADYELFMKYADADEVRQLLSVPPFQRTFEQAELIRCHERALHQTRLATYIEEYLLTLTDAELEWLQQYVETRCDTELEHTEDIPVVLVQWLWQHDAHAAQALTATQIHSYLLQCLHSEQETQMIANDQSMRSECFMRFSLRVLEQLEKRDGNRLRLVPPLQRAISPCSTTSTDSGDEMSRDGSGFVLSPLPSDDEDSFMMDTSGPSAKQFLEALVVSCERLRSEWLLEVQFESRRTVLHYNEETLHWDIVKGPSIEIDWTYYLQRDLSERRAVVRAYTLEPHLLLPSGGGETKPRVYVLTDQALAQLQCTTVNGELYIPTPSGYEWFYADLFYPYEIQVREQALDEFGDSVFYECLPRSVQQHIEEFI